MRTFTLYFCGECGWKGIGSGAHACCWDASDRRKGTAPDGRPLEPMEVVQVEEISSERLAFTQLHRSLR